MKKLIVFYSLTEYTKKMAEYIKKKTDADILEIKPVKECKKRGIKKLFFGGMQVVMRKKPPLKKYEINLEDYDCLILGSPIWVGTFTPPIRTFMTENKIKNKKVALFISHNSNKGKSFEKWQREIPENQFIAEIDWNSKKDFSTIKENLDKFCEAINKLV